MRNPPEVMATFQGVDIVAGYGSEDGIFKVIDTDTGMEFLRTPYYDVAYREAIRRQEQHVVKTVPQHFDLVPLTRFGPFGTYRTTAMSVGRLFWIYIVKDTRTGEVVDTETRYGDACRVAVAMCREEGMEVTE